MVYLPISWGDLWGALECPKDQGPSKVKVWFGSKPLRSAGSKPSSSEGPMILRVVNIPDMDVFVGIRFWFLGFPVRVTTVLRAIHVLPQKASIAVRVAALSRGACEAPRSGALQHVKPAGFLPFLLSHIRVIAPVEKELKHSWCAS